MYSNYNGGIFLLAKTDAFLLQFCTGCSMIRKFFVNKMLSKVPKFIKYLVNLNHINQPHIPIASLRINQTYLDTLY